MATIWTSCAADQDRNQSSGSRLALEWSLSLTGCDEADFGRGRVGCGFVAPDSGGERERRPGVVGGRCRYMLS